MLELQRLETAGIWRLRENRPNVFFTYAATTLPVDSEARDGSQGRASVGESKHSACQSSRDGSSSHNRSSFKPFAWSPLNWFSRCVSLAWTFAHWSHSERNVILALGSMRYVTDTALLSLSVLSLDTTLQRALFVGFSGVFVFVGFHLVKPFV